MDFEEVFMKREKKGKVSSKLYNDPSYAKCSLLVEKITSVVFENLKEETGSVGDINGEKVHRIYYSLCWCLAKFIKSVDLITGTRTAKVAIDVLKLCLYREDITNKDIATRKEGN